MDLIQGYDSSPSSSSDWEKISAGDLSSSSSDSDDENPTNSNGEDEEDWCMVKIKNGKQKLEELVIDNDDDDDYQGTDDVLDDDGKKESLYSMKEMLSIYLPDLLLEEEDGRFPLDYIEQQVFPCVPAKILLRLKDASPRWNRWISSDFFVHTHSVTARSVSGFIFHDPLGSPSFASFDLDSCALVSGGSSRKAPFSFLPEPVHVKASTFGLVCCRGRNTSTYYICNPATREWAALPAPAQPHGLDTAVVLVMKEPAEFNFDSDYCLVCAFEIFQGAYGFEAFSSKGWAWKSCSEIVDTEKVVSGSGVSVSGLACWRTTMQTVVVLDPEHDLLQTIVWPGSKDKHWEIGELGKKLCVVTGGANKVMVWVFGDKGPASWNKAGVLRDGDLGFVTPLRTQGEREVMVWSQMKKSVVGWDIERGVRRVFTESGPGICADFMPYSSTLLHVRGSQNGSSSSMLDVDEKGMDMFQD